MRGLKFRVWDPAIPKDIKEAEDHKASGDMVNWEYVKKSSYLIDGLNGKYPMMQYTGLKDKNGKEIYEGDIVEFNVVKPIWDDKSECVIEHRPETWRRVIAYKPPHFVMHWYPHKMVVIGNICENPELTEAEQ